MLNHCLYIPAVLTAFQLFICFQNFTYTLFIAWNTLPFPLLPTHLSLAKFYSFQKAQLIHAPVFLPGESQGQGSPVGLPSIGSHRAGHD